MNAEVSHGDRFTVPPLGTRLLAGMLDFLVVLVAAWVLLPSRFVYFPALLCIYHTTFVWRVGQTPGKALLGLQVRRSVGVPTLLWALGRSSVGLSLVNGFGLGFLAAVGDPARRALHDRAFGSVVVLDGAELGATWSERLKSWAARKKAVCEKKTGTIAVLSGIWSFLKSAAGKLEQFADWFGRALASLRPPAAPAVTLPGAPTVAQATFIAIGCSAATTAALALVPGAPAAVEALASPIAAFTRSEDAGVVRMVRGPNGTASQVAAAGQPVEIRVGLPTLDYTVDFGDGTELQRGAVTGEPLLELTHTYEDSSPGSSYTVRFEVTDETGITVGSTEYEVDFVGAEDDARVVFGAR